MFVFFLIIHVIICFLLILSILLFQTSKGSALSMFGGGGDSLFSSPGGTTFIKKFTMFLAIAFAINSVILTVIYPLRHRSVLYNATPPPIPAAGVEKK
ncbi:MAG: preprotein translocase subunit SecG [Elusimicrobiales bacterium]|nr:preprotein translocase subunit SecG [Elusimicrobiales bacterium]